MVQAIIPPSILPVTPLEPRLIDDGTSVFQPRFARGRAQRQVWSSPRWGFSVRFEAMRSHERAMLKRVLSSIQGRGGTLRWSPGIPLRGSFPGTEVLTNSDFNNGSTNYTAARCTAIVADRVMRAVNDKSGGAQSFGVYQAVSSLTQYAPYAIRGFFAAQSLPSISKVVSNNLVNSSMVNGVGMATLTMVALSTSDTAYFLADILNGTETLANDFFDLPFVSMARCALVDNAPNAVTYSEQYDNSAWTKTRSTITANAYSAPDGTVTADRLTEDSSATTTHFVDRSLIVSSAAADYSFTVSLKAGTRGWVFVQMYESIGGTGVGTYFNIGSGSLGTASTGVNWSNQRIFVVPRGDGWYEITIVARKTNAATAINAGVYLASGDGGVSYTGSGLYARIWRSSFSQSSLPTRAIQTTTTAVSATAQTGSSIFVKGLPSSTNGLLLSGDYFEINGELKRSTASLNSDAAGRGCIMFEPSISNSPSDNDAVVLMNPMGRFMLANVRESERFGIYTDFDLELEEVVE